MPRKNTGISIIISRLIAIELSCLTCCSESCTSAKQKGDPFVYQPSSVKGPQSFDPVTDIEPSFPE